MITGYRSERMEDIKITGTGSSGGGIFRNVKVVGEGVIHSDVESQFFKCTGTAAVNGHLRSNQIKLTGTLHVQGDVYGDAIKTSGQMEVDGKLEVRQVKINGDTIVKRSIHSEQFKAFGSLRLHGDCSAEQMRIKGAIQTEGMLNAEHIDIGLYGLSKVAEIGGHKIEIKRTLMSSLFHIFNSKLQRELIADTIEGDVLHLEHTEAKVVRGRKVYIGPGCRIGLVEYSESCKKHSDAVTEVCNQVGSL
ncbi:hypothetical protein [Paenibacillus gallinarum]|uniref:Polymer-forming cytoskeletal protein n=1 Tax=Paenibacillus gallinarum TaxID=2762232 RepID=A0ABR8SZJ7_9BACL|nr:hypothetical protein [Paenibacillus gallinarum]MBD7968918.1 hypothetical protein [Paenibacillus gallinarum]